MFMVEGRETCILLGCGAEGNFEMKPINFGTVKAKGNETNTAFVYRGGGGGGGHFGCLILNKGKLTYFWAVGNETHKFWESQS